MYTVSGCALGSCGWAQGPMVSRCEHGGEPRGFKMSLKFTSQLSEHSLLWRLICREPFQREWSLEFHSRD